MDRRAFNAIVGGSIFAAPLIGDAQQGGKMPRIGYVTSNARSVAQVNVEAFEAGTP